MKYQEIELIEASQWILKETFPYILWSVVIVVVVVVTTMWSCGASHRKSWEVSLHSTWVMWRSKNHEDDHCLFFKIPSSSVFDLALKFPQISLNSAKSCVVLLQKEQIFVLENHDIYKNILKYKNINYERAHEQGQVGQ